LRSKGGFVAYTPISANLGIVGGVIGPDAGFSHALFDRRDDAPGSWTWAVTVVCGRHREGTATAVVLPAVALDLSRRRLAFFSALKLTYPVGAIPVVAAVMR